MKERKAMLRITSESFKSNAFIPVKYTCDGANINPSLVVSSLPVKTSTLVIIVEDPDANDGPFVHWLVWNIAPTNRIGENSVPGEPGTNDFGKLNYKGPCPPSGTHRYCFKVYALDNFLHLPSTAKKADLEAAMGRSVIAYGELVGMYERRNK